MNITPVFRISSPLLLQLAKRWDIPLQNIGYVGDDLSDLECLSRVGSAFCPADAVSEILRQAHYVCERAGGQGAVREVCDLILRSRETAITGLRKQRPVPDLLGGWLACEASIPGLSAPHPR